jgi:hypothetical protein
VATVGRCPRGVAREEAQNRRKTGGLLVVLQLVAPIGFAEHVDKFRLTVPSSRFAESRSSETPAGGNARTGTGRLSLVIQLLASMCLVAFGVVRDEREALATGSHDRGRHAGRASAAAVVVDDRVAIGGAGPRRGIAIGRRPTAEDDHAGLAGTTRPQHDHVAGVSRPLPGDRHAGTADPRRDAEDIRRPGNSRRPWPSSLRGSCRPATVVRRDGGVLMRRAPSRRRPPRDRLLGPGNSCRRRRGAGPSLEGHTRRGAVPTGEEVARGGTGREDEGGEHHRPSPARLPKRSDRLGRDHRLGERLGQSRPLARVGEKPPRPLGELGVDQRKLGADRPEVCQALDVVWARVHRVTSLTGLPELCRSAFKRRFRSFSHRDPGPGGFREAQTWRSLQAIWQLQVGVSRSMLYKSAANAQKPEASWRMRYGTGPDGTESRAPDLSEVAPLSSCRRRRDA